MNCERCGTGLPDYAVICPSVDDYIDFAGANASACDELWTVCTGGYSGHHSSSHPMDKVTGRSQANMPHSRIMATRRNLMWSINQVLLTFCNNAPPATNKDSGH